MSPVKKSARVVTCKREEKMLIKAEESIDDLEKKKIQEYGGVRKRKEGREEKERKTKDK